MSPPRALGLAALPGLLLLPGCLFLPLGGRPNAGPADVPSAMGHGRRELRAAFHVHSYLSHDSEGRIEDIARAARDLGIDTVILNDHYETGNAALAPRGLVDGVLFVSGVELRGEERQPEDVPEERDRKVGSLLAFPVVEELPRSLSPAARAAEMARQGAVTVLGHVESFKNWDLEPCAGFEIYNLHAEFEATSGWSIAWKLVFLPADAFFESSVRTPADNLRRWDEQLARGRRLAALAGHDAHENVRILGCVIGTYPEMLRLFSNHLLVKERSAAGVVEAVREGKTFVVFDFLGDATGFAVSYGAPDAAIEGRAIVGDGARFEAAHTLRAHVPGPVAGDLVRVLRDGVPVLETETLPVETALPGPGVYRVEVHRRGRLWIAASPLYLAP